MSGTRMRIIAAAAAIAIAALLVSSQAEADKGYRRTVETYTVPDVTLVNQDRKKVKLRDLLRSEQPVMLDFIYGTCTTICPVLSAGYVSLQRRLGPDTAGVRMISVSIDPEHDTPAVMKEYLKRYSAKPGWDFLTGSRDDIDRVMRAFDAYVPNKMSHYPIVLLRRPGTDQWVRIYGLISTSELYREYQGLVK